MNDSTVDCSWPGCPKTDLEWGHVLPWCEDHFCQLPQGFVRGLVQAIRTGCEPMRWQFVANAQKWVLLRETVHWMPANLIRNGSCLDARRN